MTGMMMLTYPDIADLCGGRIGRRDVPCPFCGSGRRSPENRKRKVLRIWHREPGFASYTCARCGEKGYAREDGGGDHVTVQRPSVADTQICASEAEDAKRRTEIALRLWQQSAPLEDTLGWRYFVERRGLHIGPLDLNHTLRWHQGIGAVVALMTDAHQRADRRSSNLP